MTSVTITFCGTTLQALHSGALYWPDHSALVVSDLHFGKSARLSAVGGAQLPPYETRETLLCLERDLDATGAKHVICLGDSFDAPEISGALPEEEQLWIARLQAGKRWDWIEGNHDPGPVSLGGSHRAELALGPLIFRHIAEPDAKGELSGHYHPKARIPLRGKTLRAPCFLYDDARMILPAYGAYTGGLCTTSPVYDPLFPGAAKVILTGKHMLHVPRPI